MLKMQRDSVDHALLIQIRDRCNYVTEWKIFMWECGDNVTIRAAELRQLRAVIDDCIAQLEGDQPDQLAYLGDNPKQVDIRDWWTGPQKKSHHD